MDDPNPMTAVLTTAEVAHILRLSVKTVGEMMREGILPAMRIGGVWRIRRDSLETWMREQEAAQSRPAAPDGRP